MKGKRLFIVAFVLALVLTACGQNNQTSWQEQYDLGVRYLSDGNYEEAIIAFTAAIEIDPKRPEAYAKAAEAYIGLDDLEAAVEILEKGYASTGDGGLEEHLSKLKETIGGEEKEEDVYQPMSLDSISGTLSLSDMASYYEEGGPSTEYNEDAIGGMNLRFTVNGPAEVRDVYIWNWSQAGIPDSKIPELIARAVESWKKDGIQIEAEGKLPFACGVGFPVWEEDRNTTVYALLVGLDSDGNAVGYAVVTVVIP